MSKADIAAAILWFGATLYAVFGGADFGAGIWDLLAGRRGPSPARTQIQTSLTPVWEANHVWLIFILVVLWTAFPEAFSAIMLTLFIPLCLAAVGIVLRGAGFAFRKTIPDPRARQAAGLVFAGASVVTPFFMGTVVGAIACGRVPAGGGDKITSWLAPAPILFGFLFVATSAYVSAIFLTVDSRKDASLVEYFSKRALGAGVVAGIFAAAGLLALHDDGRYVYDRLLDQALPLVILSAVLGLGAIAMLVKGRIKGLRPLGVGALVAMIWAWAVAQYPYLLPTTLTLDQSAAPSPTLISVFVVFVAAGVIVLPAIGLLYTLTQKELLREGDKGA